MKRQRAAEDACAVNFDSSIGAVLSAFSGCPWKRSRLSPSPSAPERHAGPSLASSPALQGSADLLAGPLRSLSPVASDSSWDASSSQTTSDTDCDAADPLLRLRNAFREHEGVSRSLKCREEHLRGMMSFVESTRGASSSVGAFLYVCGRSGTGKTACAQIMKRRCAGRAGHSAPPVMINCLSLTTVRSLDRALKQTGFCLQDGAGCCATSVIILDELDALLSNDRQKMFSWIEKAAMHGFVIVGISNNAVIFPWTPAEAVATALSDEAATPPFPFKMQLFSPYSAEEIVAIVEDLVERSEALAPGTSWTDGPVPLQLLAKRISLSTGDFRRVLPTVCKALDLAMSQESRCVTVSHVQAALKQSMSSSSSERIVELPLLQKLILAVLVGQTMQGTAVSSMSGILSSTQMFYRNNVRRGEASGVVSSSELRESLCALSHVGLVGLSSDGTAADLRCDAEDAKGVLLDHGLCRKLLHEIAAQMV